MKKIILGLSFFLSLNGISAQTIVRSTIGSIGSSMGNETFTVQQTAGQPSATTFSKNDNGSAIRQGFHQPFYYETEQNELDALIFPNPNNGEFSFQVNLKEDEEYTYVLLDQNGKQIQQSAGSGSQLTHVKMQQAATGMYHLKISSGNRLSSFKINVVY